MYYTEDINKRNYLPQILYVLLLSVQVPANIFFVFVLLGTMADGEPAELFSGIYIVLAVVYWAAVIILGILNIIKSFQAHAGEDFDHCLNGMLILKYGMVPFFIVNFFSMSAIFLMSVVASRGMVIFAFPVVIGFVLFGMFCTWMATIPGALYGIQVIRFTRREGRVSKSEAVLHSILQFIFVLDVLDTVYLAWRKWGRGRRSSIFVLALYLLGLFLTCLAFLRMIYFQ